MQRAFYDHEPAVFEAVGNGSVVYRWDIQEELVEQVEIMPEGDKRAIAAGVKQYSCYEVVVWNATSNLITASVINHMWDANYEQKLINEYNAAMLGVSGDEEAINAYKAFLAARAALKTQIDTDCAKLKLGILSIKQ